VVRGAGTQETSRCSYLLYPDCGSGGTDARHRGKYNGELHGGSDGVRERSNQSREESLRSPHRRVWDLAHTRLSSGAVRGAIYRPSNSDLFPSLFGFKGSVW